MFESDRFTMEEGNSKDEPGKASFEWQREVIVYAVMAVVIFSFVFYFSVFFSEALGITPNWVKKCFAKKHKTHIDNLIQMGNDDGKSDVVSMNMNPLQKKMLEKEAAMAATAASAFQLKEMEEREKANQLKFKRQLSTARKQGASGRGKKKSKGKKKKKIPGQKKSSNIELGLGDDEVILIGASKELTSKEQKTGKNKANLKRANSFSKLQDPTTGADYYHNVETGETAWTLPEGAELIDDEKKKPKRNSKKKEETVNIELGLVSSDKNTKRKKTRRFSKMRDDTTGKDYYHNTEDNTTSWEAPPEDEIIQDV
jgi:hypothetical protein